MRTSEQSKSDRKALDDAAKRELMNHSSRLRGLEKIIAKAQAAEAKADAETQRINRLWTEFRNLP